MNSINARMSKAIDFSSRLTTKKLGLCKRYWFSWNAMRIIYASSFSLWRESSDKFALSLSLLERFTHVLIGTICSGRYFSDADNICSNRFGERVFNKVLNSCVENVPDHSDTPVMMTTSVFVPSSEHCLCPLVNIHKHAKLRFSFFSF